MHRSLRAAVVLLVACGGSRPPAPPPAAPAPPAAGAPGTEAAPSAACTEQAARLGAELRELAAAQPGFLPLVPGIQAPVTSAARPVDTRGVVVAITRSGELFIQGDQLADTRRLREYLEHVHRTAFEATVARGGTAADATVPLYIWADAAAPIRAVAAVPAAAAPEPSKARPVQLTPEQAQARKEAIEQARAAGLIGAGPRTPAFTFRLIATSPESAAQPAPALPASEPEATVQLADQLRAAIGTCEPILSAVAAASLEGTPAQQAETLVTDVPRGLASCGCEIADADALAAGLRTWLGAWAPPLRWIELPKLAATDARPIGKLVAK